MTQPDETTPPSKSEALLPCPFCGGEAQIAQIRAGGLPWWQGECINEGCHIVGPDRAGEAETIAAWNQRALRTSGEASPSDGVGENALSDLCAAAYTRGYREGCEDSGQPVDTEARVDEFTSHSEAFAAARQFLHDRQYSGLRTHPPKPEAMAREGVDVTLQAIRHLNAIEDFTRIHDERGNPFLTYSSQHVVNAFKAGAALSRTSQANEGEIERLRGHLASIVADPDCCAAAKTIAREGLSRSPDAEGEGA